MRILIIDDSESDRFLLRRFFRKAKLAEKTEIIESSKLASAKTELESRSFDLIVTDLTLPDGQGTSLVQHIRQDPRHCTTPILVVSGLHRSEIPFSSCAEQNIVVLSKTEINAERLRELALELSLAA